MNNETLNASQTESTFANFRRELQTLNYVELNMLMSDIFLEIKKRSYNEGMVRAMTSGISEEPEAPVKPDKSEERTSQQLRDDIVNFAKFEIAHLTKQESQNLLRPRFVVNREKRTIVCLMERFDLGYIESRGIAKCDPSDCFNAHLGRAIALRRALGLEVPSGYLNAPQPTEVRNYDKVLYGDQLYTITPGERYEGNHGTEEAQITSPVAKDCIIIDDSREEVTE